MNADELVDKLLDIQTRVATRKTSELEASIEQRWAFDSSSVEARFEAFDLLIARLRGE